MDKDRIRFPCTAPADGTADVAALTQPHDNLLIFSEGAEEEAHPRAHQEGVQQRPLAGAAEGTAHQQGAPRAAAQDQEEATAKEVSWSRYQLLINNRQA